ncbi:MAG: hypothetical protein AB8B94_16670 [Hyphomicrobiales bacterium]
MLEKKMKTNETQDNPTNIKDLNSMFLDRQQNEAFLEEYCEQ